jgi:hypothetical protein
VFIGMSANMCMSNYVCTVFLKKIVDLFEIQAECVLHLTRYHIASVRLDRNHNGRLSDHVVVSSIR